MNRVTNSALNLSVWQGFYQSIAQALYETLRKVRIVVTEALATVRYIIPASLSWWYHKNIKQDITVYNVQVTVDKTTTKAYLYLHGDVKIYPGQQVRPILLTHGDYGHPNTMWHLAQIAQQQSNDPVFSLYIPECHDNTRLEVHSKLIGLAMDKIQELVTTHRGNFMGVLAAGHSKGAILLADRHFTHRDPRIKNVFAVGGRLNVPEGDESSEPFLAPFVKNIFKGIRAQPNKKLVQIVPEEDWNAPREAMAVRPNDNCHIVPGMHLSGLFTQETCHQFQQLLRT